MKKIILLVMFFCVISFVAESALPRLDKAASSAKVSSAETESSSSTVVENDSSTNSNSPTTSSQDSQTTETSLAKLPNGKAYIGVSTFLSVRDEPFGSVLAQLHNNDEVLIVNRKGDWYEIESEKGSGWIYGKCVFDSPNSNPSTTASDTAIIDNTNSETNNNGGTYNYFTFKTPGDYTLHMNTTTTSDETTASNATKSSSSQKTKTTKTKTKKSTTKKTSTKKTTTAKKSSDSKKSTSGGTLQKKIVQAAKDIVKKYSKKGSFPYASGTKGGRLGCAQVATTVLKKAGVLKKTSLGCKQTLSMLKQAGWKKTKVPPYKAGDVIFWTTYKAGASHVGIIMESGNNVQAMSNSSSQRRPRYHKANYAKIYCVMRKS